MAGAVAMRGLVWAAGAYLPEAIGHWRAEDTAGAGASMTVPNVSSPGTGNLYVGGDAPNITAINGLPAWAFPTATQRLRSAEFVAPGSDITFAAMVTWVANSTTSNQLAFDGAVSTARCTCYQSGLSQPAAIYSGASGGAGVNASGRPSPGQKCILWCRFSAIGTDVAHIDCDGSAAFDWSGNAGDQLVTGVTVGNAYEALSRSWNGSIAEVMLFGGSIAHDSADGKAVRGMWASKYNMAITL